MGHARDREAGRDQSPEANVERSPSQTTLMMKHEQIRDVTLSHRLSGLTHRHARRGTRHGGREAHKTKVHAKVTNKISQDQDRAEARAGAAPAFCTCSHLACRVHLIALLPHVRHHFVKKKARLLFGAQKRHHGFGVHHVAVKSLRPISRIDADG